MKRNYIYVMLLLAGLMRALCILVPGSAAGGFEVRNTREYYIQAEKVEWNYLPYGQNLVDNRDTYLQDTLVNKPNRIGSRYSKYVYKQYTDATFSREIPKPNHHGYVGPLIRAEVGEVINVHFRNMADIPVSVHPHGVRYDKMNEGALYLDNTTAAYKAEDGVPPGGNISLVWELTRDFSPKDDDPSCLPFAYHSHVRTEKEINSGLLGLLLACKPGTLSADGTRSDVDKEFVLYFDSIDEGNSWLTDENIKRCQDPAECRRLYDTDDPDFAESMMKDSINGYMFGNLPGLNVCAGQKVAWYIFSLLAELHPVNIHGHTFVNNHHRTAVIGVWSASFRSATTVSTQPGRWLVSCLNSEHNTNGMKAFLSVSDCRNYTISEPLSGAVRTYFLAAETEVWDYAPSGQNLYDGGSLTAGGSQSAVYFNKSRDDNQRIGGEYKKSRFIQFDDTSFTTRTTRSADEKHLGLLGPVIRAEVGDVISILLINVTPHPVSIYLQGVSMNKSQDGTWQKKPFASYAPMEGHVVQPGGLGAYHFEVPWSVGPLDHDPQCLTYMYYSNYNFERDVNSGLVGPLLICKNGGLDSQTGKQKYIDRELFLFYSSLDENLSWYIDDNIAAYTTGNIDTHDEDFVESNIMRSINGRSYGNLEGLSICKGEQVVWHVMSFGQGEGVHGVTWSGNNVMVGGANRDSYVTISGLTFTAAMMHADNVGNWSISCHNNQHFQSGMAAIYTVDACGDSSAPYFRSSGVVRRYYIAAVERKWDYSPNTIHPLTGENYSHPSSAQYNRVQKDGKYIGSIYTKALYREFTDGTFTQEKPRQPSEVHLGVMGPFIRGEVGDVIEVVFANLASRNYSIHPMGLRYNKANEGMRYNDGFRGIGNGDGVAPGATFTYRWEVPATSGPADSQPNCVSYMYHSAVDRVKDTYSGLAGPIIICRRGILDTNGKRKDSTEREFSVLFHAFDENQSWYLEQNINEYAPHADTTTPEFEESNKYDSINGRIYNNLEGLVMNRGENIAWYILALGGSEDIHTVHFHGQTFIYRSGRSHEGDVIEVFPGTYETVEMFAENPGTWLLHCHVGEHMKDGMVATYTINP